jgi:endonuclease YncB( thermonuclease family)
MLRKRVILVALHRQVLVLICLALLLTSCRLTTPLDILRRQSTATAIHIPATASGIRETPTFAVIMITATYPLPETASPIPSRTASLTNTWTPTITISPLSCLPAGENGQYAQVKRVQDGQTIIVDIEGSLYSVRYLGIQTPNFLPVVEEYGPEAARMNASLVADQIVRLVADKEDKNSIGQLMRYVIVIGSDRFVNFDLVRLGYARLSYDSASLTCGKMLAQAEELARQDLVGMWAPTMTPKPTRTATPTRTSKPTPTLKPTANLTKTAIFLLTHTTTATPTATNTMTATMTITPTHTLTATLTVTPTGSLAPSTTSSPSPTSIGTSTSTTQP